jgi:hypothetical protein
LVDAVEQVVQLCGALLREAVAELYIPARAGRSELVGPGRSRDLPTAEDEQGK